MGTIRQYFRAHRWQRRVVTATAAIVAGLGAAIILYPHAREFWLIDRLGSDDPRTRATAIAEATAVARTSSRMVRRLQGALADSDDTHFVAIATVLKNLGAWNSPTRDVLQVDRLRVITFETTCSEIDPDTAAETRRRILADMLLSGRVNRHIERAVAAAVEDDSPSVRQLAAVLAAAGEAPGTGNCPGPSILGSSLKLLLCDDDPTVVARTIMALGLAGNSDDNKFILQQLENSRDARVVSAAAYAMALLVPGEGARATFARLTTTENAVLRDRLLMVAAMLDSDRARSAVLSVLDDARRAGRAPSAAMLLSASRLGVASIEPDIRAILSAAVQPDGDLAAAEVLAAMEAARRLNLPVRAEVEAICRRLWSPYWPRLLATAATVLGEQADMPQAGHSDAPTRSRCIQTLRSAAVYLAEPPAPLMQPTAPATTPLASAAAAAALWRMRAELADQYVRNAAARQTALAGDYIAWHLARSRPAEAFELALAMCPPLEAPPEARVYNDNERSAGAMMLALSADTPLARRRAAERVTSRLVGGPLGGEDSFHVRGAYRCALLVLGRTGEARAVRELLQTGEFPVTRAITALCAAGRRDGLDWLLWNPQLDADAVAAILAQTHLGEVIAALAPDLPAVDSAADEDILRWQVGILRDYYAIHRRDLKMRGPVR